MTLLEAVGCLALALYHEARGEPHEGQVAVAQVVRHRVASADYPDSYCGVVFQAGQFAWAGTMPEVTDFEALDRAFDLAEQVVAGAYPASPALFFHSGPPPWWAEDMVLIEVIGGHSFYAVPWFDAANWGEGR